MYLCVSVLPQEDGMVKLRCCSVLLLLLCGVLFVCLKRKNMEKRKKRRREKRGKEEIKRKGRRSIPDALGAELKAKVSFSVSSRLSLFIQQVCFGCQQVPHMFLGSVPLSKV